MRTPEIQGCTKNILRDEIGPLFLAGCGVVRIVIHALAELVHPDVHHNAVRCFSVLSTTSSLSTGSIERERLLSGVSWWRSYAGLSRHRYKQRTNYDMLRDGLNPTGIVTHRQKIRKSCRTFRAAKPLSGTDGDHHEQRVTTSTTDDTAAQASPGEGEEATE